MTLKGTALSLPVFQIMSSASGECAYPAPMATDSGATCDVDALLGLLDWSDDIPHRKGLYIDDENAAFRTEGDSAESAPEVAADSDNAEDTSACPTPSFLVPGARLEVDLLVKWAEDVESTATDEAWIEQQKRYDEEWAKSNSGGEGVDRSDGVQ